MIYSFFRVSVTCNFKMMKHAIILDPNALKKLLQLLIRYYKITKVTSQTQLLQKRIGQELITLEARNMHRDQLSSTCRCKASSPENPTCCSIKEQIKSCVSIGRTELTCMRESLALAWTYRRWCRSRCVEEDTRCLTLGFQHKYRCVLPQENETAR